MRAELREGLIQRLVAAQLSNGGWGYSRGPSRSGEPTALACLALLAQGVETDRAIRGLDALCGLQRGDGGIPSTEVDSAPCWATGLALWAWLAVGSGERYRAQVRAGVEWLLQARGLAIAYNKTVYGHDTSLIGWSWVEGTHSWVEPTGYAVLGLRAAGHGDHPRVREGVRLLLDRSIPGGGWNYGNKRIYENTLRPFPGTTGVALVALAGEPEAAEVEAGLAFLGRELPGVRAPQSLAWGVLGLAAWDRGRAEASTWLTESAERCLGGPSQPLYDALLLLASADRRSVWPSRALEAMHG